MKEEEVAPTKMQFSQDGQFIVMGYKDGRVSLFKSDSSLDEIFTTKIQDEGSPISAINIKQYEQFKSKFLNMDVGALHLKAPMLNDKKRPANLEKMRLLNLITDSS